MTSLIVGMNMGGTNIEIGVESNGQFASLPTIPTPHAENPDVLLQVIVEQVHSIATTYGTKPQALGIAIAGPTNANTGIVYQTPNIGWTKPINLRETLQNSLSIPVTIDGDTNAEAWGELHLGPDPECMHLIYITVGTGIGAGVISDGRLLRGKTGAAGEIGHIKMTSRFHGADRRLCGCGGYGCAESVIAGPHLAGMGRVLSKRDHLFRKWIRQQLIATENIDGAILARAAAAEIHSAQRVVRKTTVELARLIAMAIQAYNPEVVVLGGGLMRSPQAYFDPLAQLVDEELMPALRGTVKLRLAKVPHCGVRGAILLAQTLVTTLPA